MYNKIPLFYPIFVNIQESNIHFKIIISVTTTISIISLGYLLNLRNKIKDLENKIEKIEVNSLVLFKRDIQVQVLEKFNKSIQVKFSNSSTQTESSITLASCTGLLSCECNIHKTPKHYKATIYQVKLLKV